MIFSRALLASVAVLATIGAAHAADLIIDQPAAAVAVSSAHDWSGVYAGVSGGFGSGTVEWTGDYYDGETLEGSSDDSFGTSGWLLGVQLGANAQFDNFVLGVEGDLDWTNITGEGPASETSDIVSTLDWMGSVRARAGVGFDNVLVYGTAGLAFAGGSTEITNLDLTNDNRSTDVNALGWTAGGGVEIALDDSISLKAEYRYSSLTVDEVTYVNVPFSGTPEDDSLVTNGTIGVHTIKAGLNFAF